MGYEVDFLAVGNSGPGGDAIALRFGDLKSGKRSEQFVAIVDGGWSSSGHALVRHVKEIYGTDVVDLVISTHLDRDHIKGLEVVVAELSVSRLWMHEPAQPEVERLELALAEASGQMAQRLQTITASIQDSRDLAAMARDLGIPIDHPYAGLSAADGAVQVIGPTKEYYESLVPAFRKEPALESLKSVVQAALEMRTGKTSGETPAHETLDEASRPGPENNSSVITLISVAGRSVVLTGDAGADALHQAADYLEGVGFDFGSIRVIQVPHHGSRENVTPSVLNRYLGNPVQEDRSGRQAYVSCSPKGGVLHPARRVTNAFYRRGCTVYKTAGSAKRASYDAPTRTTYVPAPEVPFYSKVD